jgi:hypothetical protein
MLTVPQLHRQTEVLRDKLLIVLEQWQELCGGTRNHVATDTVIEPEVKNNGDDVEQNRIRIDRETTLISESINAIASDISDRLLPATAKYISKADYQDPVTGLKRYGDSTKLKLLSARDTLIDVYSKCDTIRSDVHDFMTDRGITGATEASSSSSTSSSACTISIGHRSGVLLNLDSDFQFIDRSKVQVTAVTNSKNGTATVVDDSILPATGADDAVAGEDMEEKVRLIKLRRAKELEEQMQLQMMLHSKLLNVVSYYNNYRGNLITSVTSDAKDVLKIGLNRFIHCNSSSSSSSSSSGGRLIGAVDSRRLIGTALKTVLNIVSNIISKPDQINIRKLRINHSALRDSLTGMEGGIEVLLLLGFEAQLLDSTIEEKAPMLKGGDRGGGGGGGDCVDSTPHSTMMLQRSTIENSYTVSGKVLEIIQYECFDDNGFTLPLSSYSAIFSIISPHTKWQLHLEMTEPPIDDLVSTALLDTKLSWIDWYDRLTHHRSVIETVLKDYLNTTAAA